MRVCAWVVGAVFALSTASAIAQQDGSSSWQAQLQGQGEYSGISGQSEVTGSNGSSDVSIDIQGAESGGEHPWHVHEGTCGSGGGIVGDPSAYGLLEVGDDGSANGQATIDTTLESGSDYHVNVHASQDDLGTIIACGDLSEQ